MKYYKLIQSFDDNYEIVSDLQLPLTPEGSATTFNKGEEIVVEIPNPLKIELGYLKKKESPRHYIEGAGIVVISELFLEALKKAGVTNYQVFPVVLHDIKNPRTWNNYFAFNEVGVLDAALLKSSKYDVIAEDEGNIEGVQGFHEVVLSAEKLKENPKMFRLRRSPSDQLYISDDVLKKLRELVPPEKWGIRTRETEVK